MRVIVVHGGAGAADAEREARRRAGCLEAARRGWAILRQGGDAVEAVVEAVTALEDDPEFNAGLGAVLTRDGQIQLDAAVMRGWDRAAGAVAWVARTRNPVRLARLLLDRETVLMVGPPADALAAEAGLPQVDPTALITPRQRERLATFLASRRVEEGGTVGAVARDGSGGVAAATSTGGRLGQRYGRVGDTPVIGAGTYADQRGAASATGTGEAFIRAVAAFRAVSALDHTSPDDAATAALAAVTEVGGRGGLIVVNARGEFGVAFTTAQMVHAWVREGEEGTGA